METFESIEDLKKYITSHIDDCVEWLILQAGEHDREIRVVRACDFEDLPKYLNTSSVPATLIVKSRLEDKRIEDLDSFLEVLFNVEHGVEDYKEIGMNDGQLQTLADLAGKIGMKEEAARATSAIYSWD
jgi:hypothetical protein